jgi:IS30 family transposase
MINKHRNLLTREERTAIETLLQQDMGFREIGRAIGRSHTTVRYEVNKFESKELYTAKESEQMSRQIAPGCMVKRIISLTERIECLEQQFEILFELIKGGK